MKLLRYIIFVLIISHLVSCGSGSNGSDSTNLDSLLTEVEEPCELCDSIFREAHKEAFPKPTIVSSKSELNLTDQRIPEKVIIDDDQGYFYIECYHDVKYNDDLRGVDSLEMTTDDGVTQNIALRECETKQIVTIKSTVTGHEVSLEKKPHRFKISHLTVSIDDLKEFKAQDDTLVIVSKRYLTFSNGFYTKKVGQTEVSIALTIPKIFRSTVHINDIKLTELSKGRVTEALESPMPDPGVFIRIQEYDQLQHRRHRDNVLSVTRHKHVFYHTAHVSTVEFNVLDDDFLGDDYFLTEEVDFFDLLSEEYMAFDNEYVKRSGFRIVINGVMN